MKIEDISIWEAFYGVAKHGGFSKASRVLNVNLPLLSKRIARLEQTLGVRLFQRSTRVVKLTDEGKALFPKITAMLEDLKGIETSFEDQGELSGSIRITCVPFIAQRLLVPILAEFRKLHPKVHFEIDVGERILDLVDSGFDMAIRIDKPEDSDLVYKFLAPNNLVFCASPKYLKLCNKPITKPEHLSNHSVLMLDLHQDCKFKNSERTLGDFVGEKPVRCDDGMFISNLAVNGFGVLVRSIWDVQEYLKQGKLVQVLEKHPLETFGNIYGVIPSRRYLAPRVRAFFDFVVLKASSWS